MKSLKKPAIRYFEFYKVYDDSLIGKIPEGNIVSPCDGRKRKASIETLITVCSENYGPGNYVALEIGRSPDSLPLSYWVLKIRANNQGVKRRVDLNEDQLQPIRQAASFTELSDDQIQSIRKAAGSEDGYSSIQPSGIYFESSDSIETFVSQLTGRSVSSLERQKEAGLAAIHLKKLKAPEASKRKNTARRKPGRPRSRNADRIGVLLSEGREPKDARLALKNELIEKGHDPHEAESLAETAFNTHINRNKRAKKTLKVRKKAK